MSVALRAVEYCKFCGSEDIVDAFYYSRLSRGFSFEPGIDVGTTELPNEASIVPVSVDPGIHFDRTQESAGAYKTKRCTVCANIDVSTHNPPIEVAIDIDEKAMLPYNLSFQFKKARFGTKQLEDYMLDFWRRDLRKIREKSRGSGNNPCCCGKFGFKKSLRIDEGKPLEVWVLVTIEGGFIVYRLSYGGNATC